jgi:hypothetical protein
MRILWFLILIFIQAAYTQDNSIEFENWFDFNGSYTMTQNWKVYGDAGYRIAFISEKFHRFYLRPAARFQIDNLFLFHGGMGVFSGIINKSALWELRPFQGFEIRWPVIFSVPLNHYLRFEERFFSGNLLNTFIFRSRYRLSTTIDFNKMNHVQYYYFPIQFEWFVSYGKDIDFKLNEFRGVIGLGHVFDKHFRLEFNTVFQNISTSTDFFSVNNIIFRLRLFKAFNID